MAGLLLGAAAFAQFYFRPTIVLNTDSPDFDPVAFLPMVVAL
jgi:hypothetical protein